MGGCLFFSCKLTWFDWLGARLGCLGLAASTTILGLAIWSLLLYGRAFTYHIQCVGVVGVLVIICSVTFILGMFAWCLLIDSDSGGPLSLGDGVADEDHRCSGCCCRGVCRIFCELDPWPAPAKGRPGSLSVDVELGIPNASPAARVPPSPSRLGRSSGSGSGDGRSVFRVLDRSGEVLYAARTRQAVRSWVKRNLDREKRKGIMIEDAVRPKRRLKKSSGPSPAGAVSRTPKRSVEV